MSKRIRCCLVSMVAFGVLAGTGWAGEKRTTEQAAARLTAEFPGANFYREGLRITGVYGRPLAFGTAPEDSAEQFRLSHAAVFGVGPDDLEPAGVLRSGTYTQPVMYDRQTGQYKFTLVKYTQHKEGIPVFRAGLGLLVRNEADFPLVLASSSLRDLGGFVPVIKAGPVRTDLAEAAALAAVPGLINFSEPETVIWAGVDDRVVDPAVALAFVGDNYGAAGTGKPQRWLFISDAATGAILYQENLIIFTDVVGNVQGYATQGVGAEHCEPELPEPMPYGRVNIGSTVAYANTNGDFVIPNAGTSAVTVESRLWGLWFRVFNVAGADALLSQSVMPPGPVFFTHNVFNTELVRAEVNGYLQANVVRDFTLVYNPSYPGLQQSAFPVYVNETGGYCPGNAWYDGFSITFCRAGSGYPNTAWSTVVHHEYGHHLVAMAGSGQGQYGEGMGDVMGVLITDNSGTGWGFFGNCNTPLRDADNTIQYPCSGGIHYCGQLLSGCVWSTRNELAVTNPSNYMDILANLAINAMLLHTGTSITPQITIDYLTLDDDDGNISNGTPHWNEICAGFGAHSMDCPPLQTGLDVNPTTDFISEGPNGGPFTPDSMVYTLENLGNYPIDYSVTKSASWLSLSNSTGTLAPYATTPVTVSINSAANNLPDGSYQDTVYFVNTTDHMGDTTRGVTLNVGVPAVVYEWTLDTDPGWSREGQWAFGQPTGGGGEYGGPDPTGGYTGSTVYGYNLSGDYENNLPERHLTSAPIDCTGLSNVTLKFWRWLGVEQPAYDHAYVRVSNDGTGWTTVWQNTGEVTDSVWTQQEFDISDVADNEPAVYLRWTMGPTDSSWRYCGWNIDDIQVVALGGGPPATCDDGIQNQGEDRIDCGGPCPPCECLSDSMCDDGQFCTGAETCDTYGHCQPGTPVACGDGVDCTDDSCNETTDSCDNVPNDANCDNGVFCDGAEMCDLVSGCQPGTDPCPGEDCDEVNDVCVPIVCDDDGTCEAGEDCNNCPNDCFSGGATCGNGVCEIGDGEDCLSCSQDCNGKQTGKPSGRYCCGDGDGVNPVACGDPRCTGGGNTCSEVPAVPSCCGDGTCEGTEDGFNCEVDCGPPPCGDSLCDPGAGEDPCTCPEDCGTPPNTETDCADTVDNDCDGLTDCDDADCSADPVCACAPRGDPCELDSECCSGRCHRGICK